MCTLRPREGEQRVLGRKAREQQSETHAGFLALEAAIFPDTPHGSPGRWLTENTGRSTGPDAHGRAHQLPQRSFSSFVIQTPPVLPRAIEGAYNWLPHKAFCVAGELGL